MNSIRGNYSKKCGTCVCVCVCVCVFPVVYCKHQALTEAIVLSILLLCQLNTITA